MNYQVGQAGAASVVSIGLGALLALSVCGGCGVATKTAAQETSPYVTPLSFSYTHWDSHLLQWLPAHPKYEIVEVLMDEREPAGIFFFLTEREAVAGSKKQYCYTNDPNFAKSLTDGAGDRESQYVDITYEKSQGADGATYHFELLTADGPTVWDFVAAGETDPTYASKLIDAAEAGHDLKGGLLVFYLPESTVSAADTKLSLGSESFPVESWPEISSPPYFEAFRGVLSHDVHNGYLPAAPLTTTTFPSPAEELTVGATWTKRVSRKGGSDPRESQVSVRELDDQRAVLIEDESTTMTLRRDGESLLTESLAVSDDKAQMVMSFDPPLPDLRFMEEGSTQSAFSIALPALLSVVTGTITMTKNGNTVLETLAPSHPAWTRQLKLVTSIELNSNGYSQQSHTEYPGWSEDK